MMQKLIFWIMSAAVAVFIYYGMENPVQIIDNLQTSSLAGAVPRHTSIRDTIVRGETFFDIFRKYRLNVSSLFEMRDAAYSVHRLGDVSPGQSYVITLDADRDIRRLEYFMSDDTFLRIDQLKEGFRAKKCKIPYQRRIVRITGAVDDDFISSVGEDREHYLLALDVSDIFAWDIDFSSDLRKGDTYTIVAEALYRQGLFKKFGKVLYASFGSNNTNHTAYRFEWHGHVDYYDEDGQSLRGSFLKAPLSFRRISSAFSRKRFHPVLRIFRPHYGVDYAAAKGTPVFATCDGVVAFSGKRGGYGKLVKLRHRNGYTTFYGHLSRIARCVRPGGRAAQGDVIGYVGATGVATGPHLHYEVRLRGNRINPSSVLKKADARRVPPYLMAEFRKAMKEEEWMAQNLPFPGRASM